MGRRDETSALLRMRVVNALAPPLPRRAPLRRGFAEVAEEHLDDVHRYLLMLTADHTLAEDLSAETFEKAFKSWRRYDPRRASERTWLCRIARNVAWKQTRGSTWEPSSRTRSSDDHRICSVRLVENWPIEARSY